MSDDHPLLRFDVTLHAAPRESIVTYTIEMNDAPLEVARLSTVDLPPFECTFEESLERLAALPRMFIEPDGSFVWTPPSANDVLQLDGNLYDRADRLLYVALKGRCRTNMLDDVLRAIGWPEVAVVFQETSLGVYLTEAAFREHAALK